MNNAQVVEASSRSETNETEDSFDPFAFGERKEYPTSAAQLELWVSSQSGDDANCAYNESFSVALTGRFDLEALVNAARVLSDLHESLRGHFSEDGQTFIVEPVLEPEVSHVDLTRYSRTEAENKVEQLALEASNRPYDLQAGPLVRVSFLQLSSTEIVVLLGAHHAVCDGWSLDVLLVDFGRLYSAMVGTAPLPEIGDHQSWSTYLKLLKSEEHQERVAEGGNFWKEHMNPAPEPLSLPNDGKRPARRTYKARHRVQPASKETGQLVRAFSRQAGVSPFTVLFSGLATLLHRISGANDLVIGVPVAGHPEAGMEECVGNLVNLVPVRVRFSEDTSFEELCRISNSAVLDARENASVGFGEIIAATNLPRDPSRVPLVAAIFTHVQKFASNKLVFGDLTVDYRLNQRNFETFEFNLTIIEDGESLLLRAHANADLYSDDWLRTRVQELDVLLHSACSAPSEKLGLLPILAPSEIELLKNWNRTSADFDKNMSLAAPFEERAAADPAAPAVTIGGETLSYEQLDSRASQIARLLQKRGVRRGALVGICLQRSTDMLASLLAVLKVGAAYLPLDPGFPADRLRFMVDDSGLSVVVSESELSSLHGCTGERVLELNNIPAAHESPLPSVPVSGEDRAYVLYTSGSTGKPKGVQIPHRAALNFLLSMAREPGLTNGDRLLAVTTLSFDISLLELMLPLCVGAQVFIASRQEARDGELLKKLLETHQINVMQATPVTWRILLESGWVPAPGFRALCGGEALPTDLADGLLGKVGELWNMYGPTETTVWSSCCRVTDTLHGIDVGRPIDNTTFWMLDKNRQVCPIGVPGEINIGGDGVALGYLNRPELTAEKFVQEDPKRGLGSLLYRTGDLGRYRPDGRIECLGRFDNQVKVRGFRIELEEIESVLAELDSISRAVVIVREDQPGDARLVGYLVSDGSIPDEATLREHLKKALPDYMIPQHFVFLEEIPTTPNGKVDRNALPVPTAHQATTTAAHDEGDEVSLKVGEIFARALRNPQMASDASFFDMGGSSFLAVTVIRDINNTFGLSFPVGVLFENPTIQTLAAAVRAGGGELQSTVVELQRGAGIPTFFICGIALYRGLAKNLASTCRSYGVYVPGEDVFFESYNDPDAISIPELAASYAAAVRKTVPEGPYVISGVSAGGLLAFEVARQLQASGQKVAALALLDARLPGSVKRDVRRQVDIAIEGLKGGGLGYGLSRARRLAAKLTKPKRPANEVEDKRYLLQNALAGRTTQRYLESNPKFSGPVILVKAGDVSEWDGFSIASDLGWSPRIEGSLTIVTSPGDHLGILDEPRTAQFIAEHIRAQITNEGASDA